MSKLSEVIKKQGMSCVLLIGVIYYAVVWLYPVRINNIVLWMDTSEEREAYIVTRLQWDDGTGYKDENIFENGIVSQEIFVRIPKKAKRHAVEYRLTLQNEDADLCISQIKMNGDKIALTEFADMVKTAEHCKLQVMDGQLVVQATAENPVLIFSDDFNRLVKRKWHMANVTRLWLSALGLIGIVWGCIYVKIEDDGKSA